MSEFQVSNEEISQEPIITNEAEIEESPVEAEASPASPTQQLSQETQQQKRYTEDLQQRNFAELRRIQEQKDRELDLMRREIDQLRAQSYKPAAPAEDLGIAKDAYTEVRHVEKIIEARLKEQEQRYQQQMDAERRILAERTLNAQYKDLYQVLSQENLRRLEQEEPEIAASIAANPDTYQAKVAAYKQIKKLGISENNYNALRVEERLAQNATRPKNPAAVAPRQGSQALQAAAPTSGYADTITEDVAARHRREMEAAISMM